MKRSDLNGTEFLAASLNEAMFFDKRDVAGMLQCSERHVVNLRKRGVIPQPKYFGDLPRWPKKQFLDWIAAGCPAISA
jgi:hypothetical protein